MELIIIGSAIIVLLAVIGSIILYVARERERRSTYEDLSKKYKDRLEAEQTELIHNLVKLREEYGTTTDQYTKALEQLQNIIKEINEKEHFNQTLYQIREEELNTLITNKKKIELERVDREVEEWAESAQEAAAFNSAQVQESFQKQIDEKIKELNDLSATVDDFKARRDVINQEILRARAIEEQQDFYRIQLQPESIRDIQILEEIKPKLSKFDSLDKLIYDIYIKKPTDEMIKRVLEGRAPCGIYKITRLKTGEIYIGKSTDIKTRWQQHTKSAFHCGTISHSILHTTIERDGVENFTWELLEEVPKDKLGERERYWIEFYDSKRYGLNEKAGG